jgi:hypothetical protein
MINVSDFKFSIRSGFKNRVWLGVAIVLFSSAASAQTYPVSGVWGATDDRFPGSTGGACLILKQFGIDAVLAQPFPRPMIFSNTSDLKCEEIILPKEQSDPSRVQRTAAFGITETFANRRRPFSKSYLSCNVCGRGEIGRRIGLKRDLSAPGETQDAELLKFGETFIGKPQMCRRRPELYSDTKQVDEPQLAPEVFGYHLDTLTNRKEEGLFENFARRLCGKEVCPNLVPGIIAE